MNSKPHSRRYSARFVAAGAVLLSGVCLAAGCNSNESGGHHVELSDFGTGKPSTAMFARRDVGPDVELTTAAPQKTTPKAEEPAVAEKAPVEKPVAVKSTETKPAPEKPVAAQPKPEQPVVAKKEPAQPAPQEPATEKPAPKTEVALAPQPAPAAAESEKAESKEDLDAQGRPKLADGTGGFSGVITYKGEAPKPKNLYAKGAAPKDPAVCGAEAIPDQSLIVNQENNGVKNVFVYLRKKPKGFKGGPPSDPLTFDQKHCVFIPHNLIVFAGREILVKNGDPIVHNTHTNPFRNPGFNSAIAADDRVGVKLLYRRPEPVPVKVVCDLHAWMLAYHLVLDHPFCAATDENGKFAIPDLPPGEYEFTIWQETPGYLNKELKVTVEAGKYTEESLAFDAKAFAQFNGPPSKVLALTTGQ